MAPSKGKKKTSKESPTIEEKEKDENSKEQPLQNSGKKGPKEVDGKKDGKAVEFQKKSPRKIGKEEELESMDKDHPLKQSNVELEEAKELVPVKQLCPSCNEVNKRWPPPPYVDPDPRDPTLLYPGDVDLDFQPSRGDILIIHPGLHMGLMDLHRQLPKDGFVSCYDGSPRFEFAVGDLILRMGTYNVKPNIAEPAKKEASKGGKGEKSPSQKGEETKKKGQENDKKDKNKKEGSLKKGVEKKGGEDEDQTDTENLGPFTYNPYERLELYTCSGFITSDEQAKLEAERLERELEKERLENEAKLKGSKGKGNKKTKENPRGGGKEKPQGVAKKKGDKGKTNGKVEGSIEKVDPKVPPIGKKGEEETKTSPKDGKPPDKDTTQEILGEPGVDTKPHPIPRWRYLGSQMQLDTKSQKLLEKQCPGLTNFYKRYTTAGTMCGIHNLAPILGEILINIGFLNNWYKNLEKWQKEENKFKSIVQWFKPDLPHKGELIPGMILLRPLVGREHGLWYGWGLDGKKLGPPSMPPPLVSEEEEEGKSLNEIQVEEEGKIPLVLKCDCHRKSPCPKPPCPCHLYDPCPKLPDCRCIYCNPLPRKPKPPPPEVMAEEIEENGKKPGKGKGKDAKGKGKDGKNTKDEKLLKGEKEEAKSDTDVKAKDNKAKSKDGKITKDQAKDMKDKGKDVKNMKGKEEENSDDTQEELEVPKRPYVWGAVEMYLFHGKEEGWEFWGRSDRICDTPYPLPSQNPKPKFLHVDDKLKLEEIEVENIAQENEKKIEVDKDSLVKKPAQKNSKQGAKDDMKKMPEQESAKKNTSKT